MAQNQRVDVSTLLPLDFKNSKIFDFHVTAKMNENGRENQVWVFVAVLGEVVEMIFHRFLIGFIIYFHFL